MGVVCWSRACGCESYDDKLALARKCSHVPRYHGDFTLWKGGALGVHFDDH